MWSENELASRNFDTRVFMPYTTHVLPVRAVCTCSAPQTFRVSQSEGDVTYLDSVNKSKKRYLCGTETMTVTSRNWKVEVGKRHKVSDAIAEFLDEDNKEEEEEEQEGGGGGGGKEEEEEEKEGKDKYIGGDRSKSKETTDSDINDRIPSIKVELESESCPGMTNINMPLKQSAASPLMSPPAAESSSLENSAGTPQDFRRMSSTVTERFRYRRPALVPSHQTSKCGRKAKPWSLEMVFLTLALLFISPASGGFDRGGPQHRITWGRGNSPPGSAVFGNSPTNVTAVVGHRARLPCQVKNLGLKDVSWIRQRDLHILTVGIFTYTSDDRFKVFHPHETEDWFLDVSSVTFRDSGVYECQVSTSPKVSLPIFLTVLGVQEADIPGPNEVFIQHGSTISLQCEVQAGVEAVGPVHWLKGAATLNYSSPRGGISMEVEKTPTKTMSKLYITRATRVDSGNYTCAPLFAKPDSVLVHVVNAGEESAAAVHSGSSHCNLVESILLWAAAVLPISWLFLNSSSTRP